MAYDYAKASSSNFTDDELNIDNNFNVTTLDFDQLVQFNNDSNQQRFDLFLFTQYCGPGERVWKRTNTKISQPRISYADLDVCCKEHDGCPNYLGSGQDHVNFPGLTYKNQYFARLVLHNNNNT